jgi:uncharacterized protein (DUF2141 family)
VRAETGQDSGKNSRTESTGSIPFAMASSLTSSSPAESVFMGDLPLFFSGLQHRKGDCVKIRIFNQSLAQS